MKILFYITVAVFTFKVNAVESVLYKHEVNTDNKIISIVGDNNTTNGLILIEKSFLEKWKKKLNPKRGAHVLYNIIDEKNPAKGTLLLKAPFNEKITIGKSAWVKNGYVIPVLRGNGIVEGYIYNPNSKISRKFFTNSRAKKSYTLFVYALSRGYVVISSVRSEVIVHYYSYGSSDANPIEVFNNENNITSVSDVVEMGGKVFLTGNRVKSKSLSAWSSEFNFKQRSVKDEVVDLMTGIEGKDDNVIFKTKFIPSLSSIPSILLLKKESAYAQKGIFTIIKLEKNKRSIWKKTISNIMPGDRTIVSEYCRDQYLLMNKIARTTKEKTLYQKVSFEVISGKGMNQELDLKTLHRINSEVIQNMMLYPVNNKIYVLANFNKLEKTRRDDGWYSWHGYRVDSYNVSSKCTIN